MQRTLAALTPFLSRGLPIVGLEPSCLLSFRDEVPALMKGAAVDALSAAGAAVRRVPCARADERQA